MEPIRMRLSSAHGISLVALFVALGGTGYAAARINGKNIKSNTISGKKLKNRTLSTRKLSRRAIWSLKGHSGAPASTGATGPSNAYSAFLTSASVPNASRARVAQLADLPPGDYAIFAKQQLTSSPTTSGASVECRIDTGADFDESRVNISPGQSASMALNVVRRFAEPGSAVLNCTDFNTGAEARYIKITAIRVGSVRNLPSP